MLLSISLKNWRSHENTELQFKKGTNLLIGIMGSGKSSVLDGICFALFGTFPSLERRKLTLADVVRLNESWASVTLVFESNGAEYSITRKIEKKKDSASSDAEISKQGRLLEKGPTAVTKYLEQLLHLDYDLFTRAIYSEQNNIDYFLTLDPRRRKQEIDVLLGLDKFEEARVNCTSLANKTKSKRQLLEQKFSFSAVENSKNKENSLMETIAKLVESEKQILLEIDEIKIKLSKEEVAFSELFKLREEYLKNEKEKTRIEGVISTLKQQIGSKSVSREELTRVAEKKFILEKQKQEIAEELRKIDLEYSKLSVSLGSIEEKIRSAEKDMTELNNINSTLISILSERSRDTIAKDQQALSEKILKLESESKLAESKIKEFEESLKKLHPGSAECPLCGTSLGKDKTEHILNERKESISKLRASLTDFSKETSNSKSELSKLQDIAKRVDLLSSKIEDLKKKLSSVQHLHEEKKILQEKTQELGGRKKFISDKFEFISAELQKLIVHHKETEELIKKIDSLSTAESTIARIKETLFAIKFDEALYDEKRKNIESFRILQERAVSKKNSIDSEMRSGNEMLKLIKTELLRLLDMEKEISYLMKLEEELGVYKNSIIQTQISLRAEMIESINSAMAEIWSIFYPYKDYSKIRLTTTEKDYLFEFYDRTWKSLESVASGGERACAALTLRVALSMVLTPNLSWLILDEPTHNLDSEAIRMLSDTLQTKVPEVVDQTFVITHEEGLMGSEFASSYKLLRDKGILESTKIEKI